MDGQASRPGIVQQNEAMKKTFGNQPQRQAFIEALYFPALDLQYDSIVPPLAGTCHWLYEMEEYKQWISQPQTLLWIEGSLGTGKSTLMRSLVNTLSGTEHALVLKHFFAAGGESLQNSLEGFLRSVLFQILSQQPEALQSLTHFRQLPSGAPNLGIIHLHELFIEALLELSKANMSIFLLVDALDECVDWCKYNSWDFQDFVSTTIAESRSLNIQFHLCISSRLTLDLEDFASNISGFRHIPISEMVRNDIAMYVSEEFEKTKRLAMKRSDEEIALATRVIMEYFSNHFLLAALSTRSISSGIIHGYTTKDISERLANLPEDLDSFFMRELDGVRDRDKKGSTLIFQCVFTAQRILTLPELMLACGIIEPDFGDRDELLERNFLSLSGGLLRVIRPEGHVHTDHTPFVVFMNWGVKVFLLRAFGRSITLGHLQFVRASMQCLKQASSYYFSVREHLPAYTEESLSTATRPTPALDPFRMFNKATLLKYAVQYLFPHAVRMESPEHIKILFKEIESACGIELQPTNKFRVLDIWGHLQNIVTGTNVYGPTTTALHIAAQYNMADYVSQVIRFEGYRNATESGQLPLHWAAFFGSEDVARVILAKALTDELEACTELTNRTGTDVPGDDERLFQGILMSSRDARGSTALHLAASEGHLSLAAELIESHQKSFLEKKNLLKGYRRNGKEVSELLVNQGSLVNALDCDGNTALHLAVSYGHISVVELLLKYDVDLTLPNGPDGNGKTPAQLAMSLGGDPGELKLVFKTIGKLLNAKAYLALDLAESSKPETRLVDRLFDATKVRFSRSKGPITIQLSIHGLISGLHTARSTEDSDSDSDTQFTWIHLPANNMRWIELVMLDLFRQRGVENPNAARNHVLRRELWAGRQHRGSKSSQISFMKPGCQLIAHNSASNPPPNGVSEGDFVLFMPYIHWETKENQINMDMFIMCKSLLKAESSRLPDLVSQLVIDNGPRLDQNFTFASEYARIPYLETALQRFLTATKNKKLNLEITERESDLHEALKQYIDSQTEDRDKELIIMYADDVHPLHIRRTLDQYYYYMLDDVALRNKDQVVSRFGEDEDRMQPIIIMVDQLWLWVIGDTIISSFPERETSADSPDTFGITDVFDRISQNLDNIKGIDELAGLIIRECAACFFDPTRFLAEDFQFLDMFENSIGKVTDGETACYDRFIKSLAEQDGQDSADIMKESELLRKIKHIADELKIIHAIFVDQIQALLAVRIVGGVDVLISNLERQQERVKNMQVQAGATYVSLNDLMDLRQKHANLSEAKSARKQAEDTGKQGNTILVFTIVTILFLPASFMAAFFAIPVDKFPRVQTTNLELSYVVKWMLTFTVPLAVIFIWLAFEINEILAMISRQFGLNTRKGEGGHSDSLVVEAGVVVPRKMSLGDASTGMPAEGTKETSRFHLTGTANWLRPKQKKIYSDV